MLSVAFFVIAFLCPLIGAIIGSALRRRLPQHHLGPDAIDVIKLAMGLMATVVGLTLGLLISSAKERWPDEDFGPTGPPSEGGPNRFIFGQRMLVELQPATEVQRWFKTQALLVSVELANLRWLVVSQETSTAPLVPIFILIFLSAIAIFGGFSLYAPPNPTLFAVMVLPALAMAGATFIVIELNNPFTGLLQISSRGAHTLMQTLAETF